MSLEWEVWKNKNACVNIPKLEKEFLEKQKPFTLYSTPVHRTQFLWCFKTIVVKQIRTQQRKELHWGRNK